ncbi:MAG TPA: histidine phosphatase family protein [bacterium]|nr:histidine phosphatase family protein [bacterium]
MSKLILVRHGESKWNLVNKFTGQIDVAISARGVRQCVYLSEKIRRLDIDCAFCSCLARSKETISILMSRMKNSGVFIDENYTFYSWDEVSRYPSCVPDVPIFTNCVLNERHYGDLQGMDKDEARQKYGEEAVLGWRRGFADRPPQGESLLDVYNRTIPYFQGRIVPLLQEGKNLIISAHGNSLRSIIKYIENISNDKIAFLEIYTGQMMVYHFENNKFTSQIDKLSFERPIAWEKVDRILKPKNIFNSLLNKKK